MRETCFLPTLPARGGRSCLTWCLILLLVFSGQKVHLLSKPIQLCTMRKAKFGDYKHIFCICLSDGYETCLSELSALSRYFCYCARHLHRFKRVESGWQTSTWKAAALHMSWRKCKWKQYWCLMIVGIQDTRPQMLVGMWNHTNSFIAGGGASGAATLQDSWVASHKTHSHHTIQQSCSLVFTQRSWKLTSTQKRAHGCL